MLITLEDLLFLYIQYISRYFISLIANSYQILRQYQIIIN